MTAVRPAFLFPDVGRFGLGHSLLAWARCVIHAHQTGVPMLPPRWVRLRLGPYLRRERDKRAYFLYFRTPSPTALFRRAWVLATHYRVREGTRSARRRSVMIFDNGQTVDQASEFRAFLPHRTLLKRELIAMTRSAYRPDANATPHIAIHVRLGDFTAAVAASELRQGLKNASLPVDWYADMLVAVRAALGRDVPALLYSDGADDALAPLLRLDGVTRVPWHPAIRDMLAIADAALLIGSGSGFSLWGAFLGEVPRISYPGQSLAAVADDPSLEIEAASAGDLTAPLLDNVRRRLG